MKQHLTFCLFLFILTGTYGRAQTVNEIWNLYNQKDFKSAIKASKKALQNNPDNPQINLALGRSLADLNKHKEAIPYLNKGTVEENNYPWVRAWGFSYLGICYYVTDRFEESKKNFEKCIKLNATQNATKHAKNYMTFFQMNEVYESWETIEKENIRFHFQNKSNINNIKSYMKSREDAYVEINHFFNASPFKKIDFFVWDKPEEAKRILGRNLGFANSKLCVINSRNNQTRGHEITHILSDHGIHPEIKTRLINEGVAVYFNLTNRNRLKIARQELGDNSIDIVDLWNLPDKYPDFYNYSIGGALIEFLLDNGSEKQLKDLLKNQTTKTATEVYENFDELMKKFENELVN